MLLLLFYFIITYCDVLVSHKEKHSYREVHPLLDINELDIIKDNTLFKSKEREYTILSLHDIKFYEKMTWVIMINTKSSICNSINITSISSALENDNCTLYSHIIFNDNVLLKVGCDVVYGNVFLEPNKESFDGCRKTVKIRPKYLIEDLTNLIEQPNITNTLNILLTCYDEDNIFLEPNHLYENPKYAPGFVDNVVKNYYHNKNQYYNKENFTLIKNFPEKREWKDYYSIKSVQLNAPWGLDRIDSRFGLDYRYNYITTATDITAIIIDTGILQSHNEFGGRAQFFYNAVGDGIDTDCHGIIIIILKVLIFRSWYTCIWYYRIKYLWCCKRN